MTEQYSVLMSVYSKEDPSFLRMSLESMFQQTIPTNDFVLVCDGPLTKELNEVIKSFEHRYFGVFNVVRLDENQGLGIALNTGMKFCKNNLIARMDSDDYSISNRCEIQVKMFSENRNLDILSGTIEEFENNIDNVKGKRSLPLDHSEICKFSKKRNPFNHPAVMFKKASVLAVGGYNEKYHLFEDYYLWIRMLNKGFIGANVPNTLVRMRTSPEQIKRRGGLKYAIRVLQFHAELVSIGWSSIYDYVFGVVPHSLVCLLPNKLRLMIYKTIR